MNRHMTRAGTVVLLLVAALHPGAAAAHEGVDFEVDPCVRWVGESAVHFSSYQLNTARIFPRQARPF
jgi:hypothetical protein